MIAGGAAGSSLRPQDVFATTLRAGTNSGATITTGLDMSGQGGLVIAKQRDSFPSPLFWFSTVRGPLLALDSSSTAVSTSYTESLKSFTSSGFTIGEETGNWWNNSAGNDVFWSIRRAPKFFDVVTYTGDGTTGRTINHALGISPGMVIVKRLNVVSDWWVRHRSATGNLYLNYPDAQDNGANLDVPAMGASTFTVRAATTNVSGNTYEAYLFAHDTTLDGMIQCGSYVGNGADPGPLVNLGWRPQFLMVKRIDASSPWWIWDTARSPTDPRRTILRANASNMDNTSSLNSMFFLSNGFQPEFGTMIANTDGSPFAFMAIREPIL